MPVEIYNNHYLPQTHKIDNLMNKNLLDLGPFFDRLNDMNSELVFSGRNVQLWGYFIYIFAALFLAELILKRKFTKRGRQLVNCSSSNLPRLYHYWVFCFRW